MSNNNPIENSERVVRCPVKGCEAEKLARGIHLHIMRSIGDGHSDQGEYPEGVDLEDLDEAGHEKVDVDYPNERQAESVTRLCPICDKPFKGKKGVKIHLKQIEGRKNHPQNASAVQESAEFKAVEVDEHENIISVVSPLGDAE